MRLALSRDSSTNADGSRNGYWRSEVRRTAGRQRLPLLGVVNPSVTARTQTFTVNTLHATMACQTMWTSGTMEASALWQTTWHRRSWLVNYCVPAAPSKV